MREVGFGGRPRGELGDAGLGERSFHQRGDVGPGVADRAKPVGDLQPLHDRDQAIRENVPRVLRLRAGYVRPEDFGRDEVAVRAGLRGEAEHGRRIEDHRHAVGNDRMVRGESFRTEVAHHSGDRIGHPVRKMHARVAESDACVRGGELHLLARFLVVGILDGPHEVLRDPTQRLERPDVADRIRSLVGGAQDGTLGSRTLMERQSRVRLDGVAEHVEAARRGDLRRHAARIVGIEDAQRRLQAAVRDSRLRMQRRVIEDRHAGRLASGARRGRHRDERLERPRGWLPLADRRIDVIEKVRRIRRIQVCGLRRVDRRPSSNGHERVESALGGEGDGIAEGSVGRLDAHAVEQRERDAVLAQALHHLRDRRELRQIRVGEDHHPPRLHLGEVHSYFTRDAPAEADAGGRELERILECHGCLLPDRAEARSLKHLAAVRNTRRMKRRLRQPDPAAEAGRRAACGVSPR